MNDDNDHQHGESDHQHSESGQDNHTHAHDHDGISPAQQQRLQRLVLPLILDMLRSRTRRNAPLSAPSTDTVMESASSNDSPGYEDEDVPALEPSSDENERWFAGEDENTVDEAQQSASNIRQADDNMEDVIPELQQRPTVDQQGQFTDSLLSPSSPNSPSTSLASTSPTSQRSRYRLVVYFEDRDAPDTDEGGNPSRYVAIFSIDSDAQNMPVIQSADFQQSPSSIEDILNQLFTSYCPKGTPPAKKEIIDALPTTTYTNTLCSQPKCAVCLEDFEEGSEVVELPCSHRFHGESCVKQWLRIHSSCPVCRYEMPVDDMEYEQKRKQRMEDTHLPSTNDLGMDFDNPLL